MKINQLLHKVFGTTPGVGVQPKEAVAYGVAGFGQNFICTIIGSYLTVFMTDALLFGAAGVKVGFLDVGRVQFNEVILQFRGHGFKQFRADAALQAEFQLVMTGKFLILFHGSPSCSWSKNGQSQWPPQHIQHSTIDWTSQPEND